MPKIMGRKPKPRGRSPWPDRLRAFREQHRLTQRAAAARLGTTTRAWIKWEVEGEIPSTAYAKLLDQFLRHPEDFPAPEEK